MQYLLGGLLVLPLALLATAALTGRVKIRSCCSPADARQDLRMRTAFEDPDQRAGAGRAPVEPGGGVAADGEQGPGRTSGGSAGGTEAGVYRA